jgi:hypothetical protein
MIGRHAYEESKRLAAEGDFYSLLMAAMRCADTGNTERLREAFPEVWDELNARYQAPGGVIEGDSDFEEYLRWRSQTFDNNVRLQRAVSSRRALCGAS